MANRLKAEVSEEAPVRKERGKKAKSSSTFREKIESFRFFLQDERTIKIFGIFLLMTAFFMTVAFASNLFTWKDDQAIAGADSIWKLFSRSDVAVENWLGKIGAVAALQFQNQWFGICSFLFPFLLTLFGVKILWDVTLLPIGKTIKYSLFTTVWLSTFLGYIFHKSPDLLMLAGGYGFQMSQLLTGLVGFIGTGALLVFSFIGFLVAAFNIPLRKMSPISIEEGDPVVESEMEANGDSINANAIKEQNGARIVELDLDDDDEDGRGRGR